MTINISNINSSLSGIQNKIESYLSDSPDTAEMTTDQVTLKNILAFIGDHFAEFYSHDIDPKELTDRTITLQSFIEERLLRVYDDSFSNIDFSAFSAPLTPETNCHSSNLITQQDFEYEQAIVQDKRNRSINTYLETQEKILIEINNSCSQNYIEKCIRLKNLFDEIESNIDHHQGRDELITKELMTPLLKQIQSEFQSSFHSLQVLAEKEYPIYEANKRLSALLIALQSNKIDEINEAFNNLEITDMADLTEKLGFPSTILRDTPLMPRKPFSEWKSSRGSYNREATIKILEEMFNLNTENYHVFTDHKEKLTEYLDRIERYIREDVSGSCSFSSSSSSSSLYGSLHQLSEKNTDFINVLAVLLDEESKSDAYVVEKAQQQLVLHPYFSDVSRMVLTNQKKLEVTMAGSRKTAILREALIHAVKECSTMGLKQAKNKGDSSLKDFFTKVLEMLKNDTN